MKIKEIGVPTAPLDPPMPPSKLSIPLLTRNNIWTTDIVANVSSYCTERGGGLILDGWFPKKLHHYKWQAKVLCVNESWIHWISNSESIAVF